MSKIHHHTFRNGNGSERRYVDFTNNRDDKKCALLGAMGFSSGFISTKVNLTEGQINYRLGRAEISRREFRNGTSPFAKLFLQHAREIAEPKLIAHLRTHAPESHANVRRAAA